MSENAIALQLGFQVRRRGPLVHVEYLGRKPGESRVGVTYVRPAGQQEIAMWDLMLNLGRALPADAVMEAA